MHLFYTPDIDPRQSSYTLHEEESAHCVRVLRLSTGAEINLVDGIGGLFSAVITTPHPKHTVLSIVNYEAAYGKRHHYLHIAVAPTKNIERFEWFLEKATESGIDEITPVICEHSERKEVKPDRLNKVIIAAMKQSLKAYLPRLNPITKLSSYLGQPHTGATFIAHCMDGDKHFISQLLQPGAAATILIGPEGDFSPSELTTATQAGFQPISLGHARLRTETAALAACFEANIMNR